nr:MAG TPA: hypothetical protein [Caudoviricetes sp.]
MVHIDRDELYHVYSRITLQLQIKFIIKIWISKSGTIN